MPTDCTTGTSDNCALIKLGGADFCYLKSSTCTKATVSGCSSFNDNQTYCDAMSSCVYSGTTCADKKCADYKTECTEAKAFAKFTGDLMFCKVGTSPVCADGVANDLAAKCFVNTGMTHSWNGTECKICAAAGDGSDARFLFAFVLALFAFAF